MEVKTNRIRKAIWARGTINDANAFGNRRKATRFLYVGNDVIIVLPARVLYGILYYHTLLEDPRNSGFGGPLEASVYP